MLFGKPATAEKWITDAAENAYCKTRAGRRGAGRLTLVRYRPRSEPLRCL
jgi:hypothetical protein